MSGDEMVILLATDKVRVVASKWDRNQPLLVERRTTDAMGGPKWDVVTTFHYGKSDTDERETYLALNEVLRKGMRP